MPNILKKKEAAQALARAFKVLELLQRYDITDTSAQAVILTAARTLDEHPRPVTPSDIAKALEKTVSAVARLMAKLADSEGPALLTSDRAIPGSRAEAYVLTDQGRDFVSALLTAMSGRPVELPGTHTLETFAETQRAHGPNLKLRKGRWDEDSLTLVVSPAEAFLSDEIQDWSSEFLSKKPELKTITKEGAAVQFGNVTDAVYFTLRWC